MSFSSEPGGCFFGTGTIVAVFQRSGSLPSLSELMKIAVTGAANYGGPLGTCAILNVFNEFPVNSCVIFAISTCTHACFSHHSQ